MEKRVSPLFTGYGGEPIVLMKWKCGFVVMRNYRAGSLCGLLIGVAFDYWSDNESGRWGENFNAGLICNLLKYTLKSSQAHPR